MKKLLTLILLSTAVLTMQAGFGKGFGYGALTGVTLGTIQNANERRYDSDDYNYEREEIRNLDNEYARIKDEIKKIKREIRKIKKELRRTKQ